jgi:hypothetical protein
MWGLRCKLIIFVWFGFLNGRGVADCVTMGIRTEEIMRKDPEFGREWVERTPMGRLGTPGDIVGAVCVFVVGCEWFYDGFGGLD